MYKTLIVGDRVRASTSSVSRRTILQNVESDRARVLYSSAFRRLQGKTQVFPMDENAAVRTRLTHSLEVAHVGRYLATSVLAAFRSKNLLGQMDLEDPEMALAFAISIETACLLHDIGNPPFGHFGEVAIAQWFENFAQLKGPYRNDFLKFDGNPQGFRIIATLAGEDGLSGMNLTLSQVGATLKYVCHPDQVNSANPLLRKAGAFATEQETLGVVTKKFSLKVGQRHPLAYLMETADDISYSLSDIEDGIEKGILTNEHATRDLLDITASDKEVHALIAAASDHAVKYRAQVDPVVQFRSHLINGLVAAAANAYVDFHHKVLDGTLPELIDAKSPHGRLLKAVKTYLRDRVYSHSIPQNLELSGLAIITGLLEHFRRLLILDAATFMDLLEKRKTKGLEIEKRLLDLIADKHQRAYLARTASETPRDEELGLRCHMVADYISGMTDEYALHLYQRLSGIAI
jgi:dGTPase